MSTVSAEEVHSYLISRKKIIPLEDVQDVVAAIDEIIDSYAMDGLCRLRLHEEREAIESDLTRKTTG